MEEKEISRRKLAKASRYAQRFIRLEGDKPSIGATNEINKGAVMAPRPIKLLLNPSNG